MVPFFTTVCWFFVVVGNIIVEAYLQRNFSLLPVRNVTNRENANSFANLIRATTFRTQRSKNKLLLGGILKLRWQDEVGGTRNVNGNQIFPYFRKLIPSQNVDRWQWWSKFCQRSLWTSPYPLNMEYLVNKNYILPNHKCNIFQHFGDFSPFTHGVKNILL